jgi:predicted transcriptional regulator
MVTEQERGNLITRSIQLTPRQFGALSLLARKRRRSLAFLVREAIESWLAAQKSDEEAA